MSGYWNEMVKVRTQDGRWGWTTRKDAHCLGCTHKEGDAYIPPPKYRNIGMERENLGLPRSSENDE